MKERRLRDAGARLDDIQAEARIRLFMFGSNYNGDTFEHTHRIRQHYTIKRLSNNGYATSRSNGMVMKVAKMLFCAVLVRRRR